LGRDYQISGVIPEVGEKGFTRNELRGISLRGDEKIEGGGRLLNQGKEGVSREWRRGIKTVFTNCQGEAEDEGDQVACWSKIQKVKSITEFAMSRDTGGRQDSGSDVGILGDGEKSLK